MKAAGDGQALGRALGEFAASGNAEVHEAGQWLAELAAFQYELRTEGKQPVVHLWSEARNLTRPILRIREQGGEPIVLEARKFGRAKPAKLEFVKRETARPGNRIGREQFRIFLYSQVPALVANGRGIVDLLGITQQGRLVVIELKAKEDIQLPLQAFDYWLRVRRHQLQDDFHAEGILPESKSIRARHSCGSSRPDFSFILPRRR